MLLLIEPLPFLGATTSLFYFGQPSVLESCLEQASVPRIPCTDLIFLLLKVLRMKEQGGHSAIHLFPVYFSGTREQRLIKGALSRGIINEEQTQVN